MDILLWIIQIILASMFAVSGGAKLFLSKDQFVRRVGWAEEYSADLLNFIGFMEVLGAVGVILPQAIGVAEVLTPIAAIGLSLMMLMATSVHLRRRENKYAALTAGLFVLALIVVIGRFLV